MKYLLSFLLILGAVANAQEESYPVHPDMEKKDGVPVGEIRRGTFANSAIFPGTTRDYAVYVPGSIRWQKASGPDGVSGWDQLLEDSPDRFR